MPPAAWWYLLGLVQQVPLPSSLLGLDQHVPLPS